MKFLIAMAPQVDDKLLKLIIETLAPRYLSEDDHAGEITYPCFEVDSASPDGAQREGALPRLFSAGLRSLSGFCGLVTNRPKR